MFKTKFRVGTRASPLALKQTEEAIGFLKRLDPKSEFEVVRIETYGDKDKTTPISEIEGSDFFTREIDEALLRCEIDFAVHSAKDVANELADGLTIAAVTKSVDPHDALVSKGNLKLDELPVGATIGTSSQRRKEQLKRYRPDFKIVNIRGAIEERLAFLDGNLDAIVIAASALVRLGLETRIAERMPFTIMKPHPLQGSLAVVARREDLNLISFLSRIDTRETVLL